MSAWAPFRVPEGPEWVVDWTGLDRRFDWVADLRGCPQDPIFHAEGDVWIHTRMVLEALVAEPAWRALESEHRAEIFVAALMHDIAKPRCTAFEDQRVRSPGHSPAGARMARRIGWELELEFRARERITGLIRHHQVPYHWASRRDPEGLAIRMSQTTRIRDLAMLARADIRGRICPDQESLLEEIELLALFCEDVPCLEHPFEFASDRSRAEYFRRSSREPRWHAYDDSRLEVTLMVGLPGAGKSTWVEAHAGARPVISLDAVRRERKVSPRDNQASVVAEARERAREHLRAGRDFIWDATNLTRNLRRGLIDLFSNYGARMHIVYVEAGPRRLWSQNAEREHAVPVSAVASMLDRLDVPDPTEAERVTYVVDGVDVEAPISGPSRT